MNSHGIAAYQFDASQGGNCLADQPKVGFDEITTVAAGNAPHQSFSDSPPFKNARWGDYSFAVPDPDNGGVWLATEYIPPAAFQAKVDNWGTDVFEVIRH